MTMLHSTMLLLGFLAVSVTTVLGASVTHSRTRFGPSNMMRPCIDIHEVAHGQVTCSFSGCRMRCNPGYAFIPSEDRQVVELLCDHDRGRLTFRDQIWRPDMTLCSPMCTESCHNGGTCVAPDKCACPSVFSGDHCDEEPMLGDQPYAGYHPSGDLKSNQRRVTCEPGTRMPDGSTSVTLTYMDNNYFYPDGKVLLGVDQVTCEKIGNKLDEEKPQGDSPYKKPSVGAANRPRLEPFTAAETHYVPQPGMGPTSLRDNVDRTSGGNIQETSEGSGGEESVSVITARCNPICRNGGRCVRDNTCICPLGYFGRICENTSCDRPRFEGDLYASLSGTAMEVQFECPAHHRTLVGRTRVSAVCRQGVWRLPGGKLLVKEDVQCLPRS